MRRSLFVILCVVKPNFNLVNNLVYYMFSIMVSILRNTTLQQRKLYKHEQSKHFYSTCVASSSLARSPASLSRCARRDGCTTPSAQRHSQYPRRTPGVRPIWRFPDSGSSPQWRALRTSSPGEHRPTKRVSASSHVWACCHFCLLSVLCVDCKLVCDYDATHNKYTR